MLESLLPPGIQLYVKSLGFGPGENKMGEKGEGEPSRTHEDKAYYALYEVANKLLPTLKENLLKAVLFSIMAEFRHALDAYYGEEGNPKRNKIQNLVKNISQDLGPEYEDMFKNYVKKSALYKSPAASLMRRVNINDPDLQTTHGGREASYKAMLTSGKTPEQWAILAYYLFKKGKWESSFGGPAWASIADAWLKLYRAKNGTQIIAWIDRIYDLQHNTDTVFNKLESYAKAGDYQWLKKALDHKRDIKSPYEIINKVSPQMKELAKYAIHHIKGTTWEEFEKEKSQFDKEKAERHGADQPDYSGGPQADHMLTLIKIKKTN